MLGPAALGVWWLACKVPKELRRSVGPIQLSETQRKEVQSHEVLGFLARFGLPILLVTGVQAAYAKAQINWALPFVLPACLWIAWLAARHGKGKRQLLLSTMAGVLLAGLVAQAGALNSSFGGAASAEGSRWDIWSRMRGWDESLAPLELRLQEFPGVPVAATDRNVIAHARHAWRKSPGEVGSWPAVGAARHHYEAVHPVAPPWPAQLLLLLKSTEAPPAFSPYRQWRALGQASSGRVSLSLWLASDLQPAHVGQRPGL